MALPGWELGGVLRRTGHSRGRWTVRPGGWNSSGGSDSDLAQLQDSGVMAEAGVDVRKLSQSLT